MKKFRKILVMLSCIILVLGMIVNSYSAYGLNQEAGPWAVKTTGRIVRDNYCGFGSRDALVWAYINATGRWGYLTKNEISALTATPSRAEAEDGFADSFNRCGLSDSNLLKGIMDKYLGAGAYADYCKRHGIKDKTAFDTSSFGAGEYGYLFGKTNNTTKAPAANTASQDELLAQYQAALAKQQKSSDVTSQEELLAQYYAALAKQQK